MHNFVLSIFPRVPFFYLNLYSSLAAFVLKHPLVASAVFGATKLWQLQEVIKAIEVELSPEIVSDIDSVHSKFPNPCP